MQLLHNPTELVGHMQQLPIFHEQHCGSIRAIRKRFLRRLAPRPYTSEELPELLSEGEAVKRVRWALEVRHGVDVRECGVLI
jgi:hypothetical protein